MSGTERVWPTFRKITSPNSQKYKQDVIVGSRHLFSHWTVRLQITSKTPNINTFTFLLNTTIPYLTEAHSTYTIIDFTTSSNSTFHSKKTQKHNKNRKKTPTFSSSNELARPQSQSKPSKKVRALCIHPKQDHHSSSVSPSL